MAKVKINIRQNDVYRFHVPFENIMKGSVKEPIMFHNYETEKNHS